MSIKRWIKATKTEEDTAPSSDPEDKLRKAADPAEVIWRDNSFQLTGKQMEFFSE